MIAAAVTSITTNPNAKRRYWHLRDRDLMVIAESFKSVETCYHNALEGFQRDTLTVPTMTVLCDAAYHFDRIAHIIFELNLGFDEPMTNLNGRDGFLGFTSFMPLFNAVSNHVQRLIELQPTREAKTVDLEKLFQLSGVMATGALLVIDQMEACHG